MERKGRERMGSSSSYFLHSDNKPIVDELIKKKRKTTPHWFWRSTKFRLKKIQITNENMNVEDHNQNLCRVLRHVDTDPKSIATCGYKAVELQNYAKDTTEERDKNPDELSLLGYKNECVGKRDLSKTVVSGSKPKELKKKSLRVRKESRVDPIIGIIIIMVTLLIMLMWGRLCAILCTSTWCYFLPRLKQAATVVAVSKRKRSKSGKDENASRLRYLDLNSEAYKKKVVLEGFLDRQHRISL